MGPPAMSMFWWENDDRAGGFGKNPSKSFASSDTKPIFRLLMLQTQPFLHQPPSRISSVAFFVAKCHGSFQFYRGSFAGAGFSCPGRTFGCTLGHRPIR